ncbi:MAG TPA: WhiB family transcriptional regulator [Pseudonocardiaceae bacterium]
MADTRRLPTPITEVWDWQMKAACRGMNSALFFHPENERGEARRIREARAKAICRTCPVINECREHALRVHETHGVWGGLGENELRTLLQRR